MVTQDCLQRRTPLSGWYALHPEQNHTCVRKPASEHQLTKPLVVGEQDATARSGIREHIKVTRTLSRFSQDEDCLVAILVEIGRQPRIHTLVNQKAHRYPWLTKVG